MNQLLDKVLDHRIHVMQAITDDLVRRTESGHKYDLAANPCEVDLKGAKVAPFVTRGYEMSITTVHVRNWSMAHLLRPLLDVPRTKKNDTARVDNGWTTIASQDNGKKVASNSLVGNLRNYIQEGDWSVEFNKKLLVSMAPETMGSSNLVSGVRIAENVTMREVQDKAQELLAMIDPYLSGVGVAAVPNTRRSTDKDLYLVFLQKGPAETIPRCMFESLTLSLAASLVGVPPSQRTMIMLWNKAETIPHFLPEVMVLQKVFDIYQEVSIKLLHKRLAKSLRTHDLKHINYGTWFDAVGVDIYQGVRP